MPAVSNVVINDGATTPVAHTFSPSGIDSQGVAEYHDRSGGVAIGFSKLAIRLRNPLPAKAGATSTPDRQYRATMKIVFPVLETVAVGAAPQKAFDCQANLEFILPERASLQNRKDLNAFAKNALAHAVWTSVAQDLEQIY